MTTQVIIHPRDGGGIALVIPAPCGLTVAEIARKDVPAGVPFRIIPADSVPTDHTFFAAWEADFTAPDGHGIGAEAWFAERESAE